MVAILVHDVLMGCVLVMVSCLVVNAIRSRGCPQDWRQYGQSCFAKVTNNPLYWAQARQMCLDVGGDLAVRNSEAENDFIWNMQREVLDPNKSPLNIWQGCTYGMETNGQWKCYGDHQTEYRNLKKELESDSNGCLTIKHNTGKWGLNNCTATKKRFICELNRCISSPLHCFANADSGHHVQPYCLLNHTFKEIAIKSPMQCCVACSKNPNCRSFNLSGKMCQLNDANISQVDVDNDLQMGGSCAYYEIQ